MHVAGELTPWLDAAFGVVLAVLIVVTAELLARYAEAATRPGRGPSIHSGIGDTTALAHP